MIINNGPIGGKFNPLKDILFSYSITENDVTTNYSQVSLEDAQNNKICSFFRTEDNNKNWDLKILENCSIVFKKQLNSTIFMVGGGGSGNKCGAWTESYGGYTFGGSGGNGGYYSINTKKLNSNSNLIITIGKGQQNSNGSNTEILINSSIVENLIAYGGEGGGTASQAISARIHPDILPENVGSGGKGQQRNWGDSPDAGKGQNGYQFHGFQFGGGGGGGGANSMDKNGYWTFYGAGAGDGGIYGGGAGGKYNNPDWSLSGGENGIANTGGGGGGGNTADNSSHADAPGIGGSGIVIISNYLSDFSYI